MNKELRKAIYKMKRLKNIFGKHPIRENELNYKKQHNKYVSLRNKYKNQQKVLEHN